MESIEQRYASKVLGKLECLDRVVVTGTLCSVCYAEGMTSFLYDRGTRIFDYSGVVEPLRDSIRENAEQLAKKNGIEIFFVRRQGYRKEAHVQRVLDRRGNAPGLVCILSAMESCSCFKPWYDKKARKTYLKHSTGKCLHYYFYFMDPDFGLCYVRVPTWAPFRLQVYLNGHGWLSKQLEKNGIEHGMEDNAMVSCSNWKRAQQIADNFPVKKFHRRLEGWAQQYCPVQETFDTSYHWSLMQVEFATDLVFAKPSDLEPLYRNLTGLAIHAIKADNVAKFLGKKGIHGNFTGEVDSRLQTRIEGTCIKHSLDGKAGVKMYDKFGHILRLETTVNDVTLFKDYREVEHRDGSRSMKYAPMRKSIYSLPSLISLMRASNGRYQSFLSALEDSTVGLKAVHRVAEPAREKGRSLGGFNLLREPDHEFFLAIARGEFHIQGFTNKRLRSHLAKGLSSSRVSRLIKRLRTHGLVKKVGKTYKYYFTALGRKVVATALKLRELVVIPGLA